MNIRGASTLMVAAVAVWFGAGPAAGQMTQPALKPVIRAAGSRPSPASWPATESAVWPGPASRPAMRSAASQPAMLRVDEATFDFGKIWDSDTFTHTFKMVNTGSRTVKILNVHATCGCTTTETWEKQVEPGQTWELLVKFVAANRRGKTSKSVVVETDDPGARRVTFVFEGEIMPRFEITPAPSVNFGVLHQASADSKTLSIVVKCEEKVTLKNARADTDLLKVNLREVEPGRKYELDVETVPPLKVTNIRNKVLVETDSKEQPEISVPVYAYVQPRILILPQTVMVPQPLNDEFRRRVVVRASEGVTFHVKEATASNPKVDVKVEPVREGREYQIWLTVPARTALAPTGEELMITTDDPQMPTLKGELRTFVAPRPRNPVTGAWAPGTQRAGAEAFEEEAGRVRAAPATRPAGTLPVAPATRGE